MTKPPTPLSPKLPRYYDIDWLRVFTTLIVFFFHASKPFLVDPWHVKNAQLDPVLDAVAGLVDVWMMRLLFVVLGLNIAFSLRSRNARRFARERLKRLMVPFLFGLLLLSPLMVYIERLYFGQFQGTFLQFIPVAFDGLYLGYGEGGNFAWMGIHLWYLGALFLYSLLLLPLFLPLSGDSWREWLEGLGLWLEKPGALLLSAVPLMLLSTLNPAGLGWRELGPWNFPVYLALLVYGFLMGSCLRFEGSLFRYQWVALGVCVAAGLIAGPLDDAAYGTAGFFIGQAARGLVMWCFITFLLGVFYPLRGKNNLTQRYTSEMVLPFYMLHQPVIIVVGYYLVLPLDLAPLVKFLLLVVLCLPIVVLIYETLVRRVVSLRVLFGLKPKKRVGRI